jgi:ribosomal peptide maturation radical SAM protein 1
VKRVFLINMPFAALNVPSFGLTQIKSVLERQFEGRLQVDLLYLNYDFAHYIGGVDLYSSALTVESLTSGIGEWFFRQSAFPDQPDNIDEFFQRYYYRQDEQARMTRRLIQEKRAGLDDFLDGLIDKYGIDQGDVVGFTSFFSQNLACFAMAHRLKRRRPGIVTVMSGPNCESVMGQEIARQVGQIDYVFSDPALRSFPDFLERWLAGDRAGCDRIDDVFSKRNADLWVPAPGRPSIAPMGAELDIDTPVPLDYGSFLDTLEANFPNGRVKPVLFFETSRGCWWRARAHCTFCGLNGASMKYRAMKPELARAQFQDLFKYANRVSRFDCVDNIMPKEYLEEVFSTLETPPHVRLFYEVRADLREQDLAILTRANVKVIQPGIETLATSILKLMRKGTTAFHNLAFLKNCVTFDVFPVWNLLVGFPGEDEDVYRAYVENIPLLTHLPPGGVFPVRFDRFSPYFNQAAEYGLDLRPFDFYGLTYPFPPEARARLAYYFIDHNGSADYIVKVNRWLDRMREQYAYWHKRWYDSPGRPLPRLFVISGGATPEIFDSRGDGDVIHRLDTEEGALLAAPATPKDMTGLTNALPGPAAPARPDLRGARSLAQPGAGRRAAADEFRKTVGTHGHRSGGRRGAGPDPAGTPDPARAHFGNRLTPAPKRPEANILKF